MAHFKQITTMYAVCCLIGVVVSGISSAALSGKEMLAFMEESSDDFIDGDLKDTEKIVIDMRGFQREILATIGPGDSPIQNMEKAFYANSFHSTGKVSFVKHANQNWLSLEPNSGTASIALSPPIMQPKATLTLDTFVVNHGASAKLEIIFEKRGSAPVSVAKTVLKGGAIQRHKFPVVNMHMPVTSGWDQFRFVVSGTNSAVLLGKFHMIQDK